MANPWEHYSASKEEGPWSQYSAAAPAASAPAAAPKVMRKDQLLGLQKGTFKPLDNLAGAIEGGLDRIGVPTEKIARTLGSPTAKEATQSRAVYVEDQASQGVVPGGLGEFVGNVAGTLPTAMIPGGALVQGAAGGALLSDAKDAKGLAIDAATGGIGGKLGEVGINALGKAVAPKFGANVQKLLSEGIDLTPGQLFSESGLPGKMVKGLEDVATGIPVVGDFINGARNRSTESFNRAAYNRALLPIGQQMPKDAPLGHDAYLHVKDALSEAYQKVLPKIKATVDAPLGKDLAALKPLTDLLPPQQQAQLQNIVKNHVFGRLDQTGSMSGEVMKLVDSELGAFARQFSGPNASPTDQILGKAVDGVKDALRNAVSRQNPAEAPMLAKINNGYAQLKHLEGAAGAATDGGAFTASQLRRSAVKGKTGSSKAGGGNFMQDLAEAGQAVLPSKIADSGTPKRLLTSGLLLGGAAVNMPLTAAAAASIAPYTKAGGLLTQKLLSSRPAQAKALRGLLERYAAPAAALMAPSAVHAKAKSR